MTFSEHQYHPPCLSPPHEANEAELPFDSVTENRRLLNPSMSRLVGKEEFWWQEELSEGGQKLYYLLIQQIGDTNLLPDLAVEIGFNLEVAMSELRESGLIDESDSKIVQLVSKSIERRDYDLNEPNDIR